MVGWTVYNWMGLLGGQFALTHSQGPLMLYALWLLVVTLHNQQLMQQCQGARMFSMLKHCINSPITILSQKPRLGSFLLKNAWSVTRVRFSSLWKQTGFSWVSHLLFKGWEFTGVYCASKLCALWNHGPAHRYKVKAVKHKTGVSLGLQKYRSLRNKIHVQAGMIQR